MEKPARRKSLLTLRDLEAVEVKKSVLSGAHAPLDLSSSTPASPGGGAKAGDPATDRPTDIAPPASAFLPIPDAAPKTLEEMAGKGLRVLDAADAPPALESATSLTLPIAPSVPEREEEPRKGRGVLVAAAVLAIASLAGAAAWWQLRPAPLLVDEFDTSLISGSAASSPEVAVEFRPVPPPPAEPVVEENRQEAAPQGDRPRRRRRELGGSIF